MSQSSRGEAVDAQHASYRTSSPTAAEIGRPGPRSALGALLAAVPLVAVVLAALAPGIAAGVVVGLVVGVALVPVGLGARRLLRRRRATTRRSTVH